MVPRKQGEVEKGLAGKGFAKNDVLGQRHSAPTTLVLAEKS